MDFDSKVEKEKLSSKIDLAVRRLGQVFSTI
jgi:hypothetical protein